MRLSPRLLVLASAVILLASPTARAEPVDFNRDIRPILSNNCFHCHGPDPAERKGGTDGLRLDTREGAFADLGGHAAIVAGKPEASELVRRVTMTGGGAMPPRKTGKKLSPREIELLTRWVKEGGQYATHWSYVAPKRPAVPTVKDEKWVRNAIDRFILARLDKEGLRPTPEADRYALIRRLSLDLTGLPPTPEEADAFAADTSADAYEKLVDRLLAKPAFGEHWARLWLDLARYADSAGYADDPSRTIWAYRDYVIRSFNANKRFDTFTVEQIAGDLLPDPTEEQLTATAFHRNTLTNNEGGTNDEEFRNVAIVDRVNTTLAVWMGTSMACAQCHTHKYDPITQKEYFGVFAIFNNTADADRRDESPLLEVYTDEQKRQRAEWERQLAALEPRLRTPTPALLTGRDAWDRAFPRELTWQALTPTAAKPSLFEVPLPAGKLTALRLQAPAGAGKFAIAKVSATLTPPAAATPRGRYVRVEVPGKGKLLSLAEVQAFAGGVNVAPKGTAKQSSTAYDGPAKLAIDGNTNGDYFAAKSTTHTDTEENPWWEVDLGAAQAIEKVVLWNRTDGGTGARLVNFRVLLLDEKRQPVWQKDVAPPPNPSAEFPTNGARPVAFAAGVPDGKTRWTPAGGKEATLLLPTASAVEVPAGSVLTLTAEGAPAGLKLSATDDARAAEWARTPAEVLAVLHTPADKRTEAQVTLLTNHYLTIAPELAADREQVAGLKKSLTDLKPSTTVPIFRELAANQRRKTRLQHRGNFEDLGEEVTEHVPAAFHPLPEGAPRNRLTLAKWLIAPENPLTARVTVNRFWEQVFGVGIVRSTEEFGSQGELPSHPELLDWLAVEFREGGWDVKAFLKLLVTSAAYRQSSRVTPELAERDPENRLLARGPRFRLGAEQVRDQALFAGGLLSAKMYGTPVRPPRPASGLSAAFGGSVDWQTSAGEDRYRRAIYTEVRRTAPYPSMATFDAPNREVCTLRRSRTNTPLQALVTMNDPVYVEAAQGLARRMIAAGTTPADRARHGFRVVLTRLPTEKEVGRLVKLYEEARAEYAAAPEKAKQAAGTLPAGADATESAAWGIVANVLLNLDEAFMKR